MRIIEIITVDWGMLPDQVYPVGAVTSLVGDTGAGKSSMLDAIMAVMTGAAPRYARFNAASEGGHNIRHQGVVYRTLQSYILGEYEGAFLRDSAHGYVALVIVPDYGEETKPFTAIVGASAYVHRTDVAGGTQRAEARLGTVHRVILSGAEAKQEDFYCVNPDGSKTSIRVEEFTKALSTKYVRGPKGAREVDVYDLSAEVMPYLARLYGHFRGKQVVSKEEAEQACTAFTKFISQEKVENISAFVRSNILSEPTNAAAVDNISKTMRQAHRMREHSDYLHARITQLKDAQSHGEIYTSKFVESRVMQEAAVNLEVVAISRDISKAQKDAVAHRAKARTLLTDIDRLNGQNKIIEEELQDIRTKLSGIKSYNDEKLLRKTHGEARVRLSSEEAKAKARGREIAAFVPHIQAFRAAAESKEVRTSLASLVRGALLEFCSSGDALDALTNALVNLPEHTAAPKFWESITERYGASDQDLVKLSAALCGEDRLLSAEIIANLNEVEQERARVTGKLDAKTFEAAKIERTNEIELPGPVKATLAYLNRHCPESKPMVLCDLVLSVRHEEWQAAIEGYIGGNRFDILVEASEERRVHALLDRSGIKASGAVQVQLALRDARTVRLENNSIVHELEVENPTAKAYLQLKYGSVVKVDDAADFNSIKRGVTKTGRGAGGYRSFDSLAENSDLTFGKRARARRMEAILAEVEKLKAEKKRLDDLIASLNHLKNIERALYAIASDDLASIAVSAQTQADTIRSTERQLANLDLSDAIELKAKETELANTLAKHSASILRISRLHQTEDDSAKRCDEHAAVLSRKATVAETALTGIMEELGRLVAIAPWVNVRAQREATERMIDEGGLSKDTVEEKSRSLLEANNLHHGAFMDAIRRHNSVLTAPNDAITQTSVIEGDPTQRFNGMSDLVSAIKQIIKGLEGNELSVNRAALARAEDNLRETFVNQICLEIASGLEAAQREIRELNAEISTRVFGSDRFEFSSEWASKEFKERAAFFSYLKNNKDEQFNLFASEPMPQEEFTRIRDELIALLRAKDEEDSRRRLLEISDHRNYRVHDLEKIVTKVGEVIRISVTKRQTDSGGEKETGIFVARVASISRAFRLREPGTHLRFVAIDELMQKTGESRLREVADYLKTTLNLQVIFATMSRAIGPFKDLLDDEHNFTRNEVKNPGSGPNHRVTVQHHRYKRDKVVALRDQYIERIKVEATARFEQSELLERSAGEGLT
jgi:hypothetical protein